MSFFQIRRNRRSLLLQAPLIFAAVTAPIGIRRAWPQQTKSQILSGILAEVAESPILSQNNRAYREAFEIPIGGREQPPTRAKPSKTKISDRATSLIISFEVSSPAIYTKKYTQPVWPRGSSGVTLGIGYDVGYTKSDELNNDWNKYITAEVLDKLSTACSVRGEPARLIASKLSDIEVPWEIAHKQYLEVMQPRYVGMTERALPNFGDLSEDCRGALVSLVYNRGASFKISKLRDPSNRYAEMRAIREAMIARRFDSIPELIRAMKRLWSIADLPGLHKRRDAEALLFEIGLV